MILKNLLEKINKPEDLKKIPLNDLPIFCNELRDFIIESVAENPGHLASNLGVVELTTALHYVFNTPEDKLIWDVGHQAYAHKILTGRKKYFSSNRKLHGLSGFPKMYESPYDAFGTGHSGTSVSAALGMAIAAQFDGNAKRQHIAVIGDASIASGIAFEALNHAGETNANLLVILNDNGIAIDKNVGALKEYFAKITASKSYNIFKGKAWRLLKKTYLHFLINKLTTAFKSAFLKKSGFFETLNFRYFGPVNGHDVRQLINVLDDIKEIPGTKLLHVVTVKGKGLKTAENDQTMFHAPGKFDAKTGEIKNEKFTHEMPLDYQTVFGKSLVELAEKNPKIVAVTPAMLTGSSLICMQSVFPERTFDVGIAEQHAVTFSAGLATQGYIPYCTIYSAFLQRAYDQIINDVALQDLPVVFCIDRAGLVGEDGETHHGPFDIGFLRLIPNIIISAPIDEIELRNLMFTAQINPKHPFAIRYPKGTGVHKAWQQPFRELETGKAQKISDGDALAVLSIGHAGNIAIKATKILQIEDIYVEHYNMIFIKPIDKEVLHYVFKKYNTVITIEQAGIIGGLYSSVSEFAVANNYKSKVIPFAIPDKFITHGTNEELYDSIGINETNLANTIKKQIVHKEHKVYISK